MLRVSSGFAAALARTLAGFVGMLACSPVVPGSESNQVSSVTLHYTYSMPENLAAVNLLFKLLFGA